MTLAQKIEAILLFKNEPMSLGELSRLLKSDKKQVEEAVSELQRHYVDRGIVVVSNGDEVSFGTHPTASSLIEDMQKEELARELGRAGLETLAIVLYKGPVSRREIDYIRGVNSGFILRALLVRGLIERSESLEGERSYTYKPTLELLRHLGVSRREDLPEWQTGFSKAEEFAKTEGTDDAHQ